MATDISLPSHDPRTPRIPLNIVTGGLGSGKTTLIARLLRDGIEGIRPAVLVNEIGEVGIDGAILGAVGSEITELPSGCICCMVSDDLREVVERVLDRKPDMVVIETSGAAYPDPLLYSLMGLGLTIDAVIAVADALHLPEAIESSDTARAQLQAADCILLNKVDLVSTDVAQKREAFLRQEFDAPLILPTSHAATDHALIFGSGRTRSPEDLDATARAEQTHHEHRDGIETLVMDAPSFIDPSQVPVFLRRLPDAAFRVKGVLDVAGHPTVLNVVGGRGRLGAKVPNSAATGKLVFVGQGLHLERHTIELAIKECLASQ